MAASYSEARKVAAQAGIAAVMPSSKCGTVLEKAKADYLDERMTSLKGSTWRKHLFDWERLRELQTGYVKALEPLDIRRGEPGRQAVYSEVRQFYGAVNASKTLPERVKLPPQPKAPKPPSGMAAEAADVVSSVLGFETTHQRAIKAHAEVMKQRRETCEGLRQQDFMAWDVLKARSAMAPLTPRRKKHADSSLGQVTLSVAQQERVPAKLR